MSVGPFQPDHFLWIRDGLTVVLQNHRANRRLFRQQGLDERDLKSEIVHLEALERVFTKRGIKAGRPAALVMTPSTIAELAAAVRVFAHEAAWDAERLRQEQTADTSVELLRISAAQAMSLLECPAVANSGYEAILDSWGWGMLEQPE